MFSEIVISGYKSSSHGKVLTLLESSITKCIFVSSNIKESFINTIFLQFFHKLCKKRTGNTEFLVYWLFLQVLFWGIISETFFPAL